MGDQKWFRSMGGRRKLLEMTTNKTTTESFAKKSFFIKKKKNINRKRGDGLCERSSRSGGRKTIFRYTEGVSQAICSKIPVWRGNRRQGNEPYPEAHVRLNGGEVRLRLQKTEAPKSNNGFPETKRESMPTHNKRKKKHIYAIQEKGNRVNFGGEASIMKKKNA